MRYMLRLFSVAFAILCAPIAFIASAAAELFQPSARENLALDRLVEPVVILRALRSRFRAFIDIARTHLDYSAGHFDPGRMAA